MRIIRKIMNLFRGAGGRSTSTTSTSTHRGTSGGIIGAIKGFFRGRRGRTV